MEKLIKILIINAGPEITYLVVGPGITIRSTLFREKAAQLLEQGHLDLILGPQNLLAAASDREFPKDKAA
ncbi:MAG TPA: hypothetical protein VLR91_04615 [Thermodesulfobacteriota bacterium]|nr:hypothetical protein [Thermodesulfobacteriota bacterium]